MKKYVPFLAVTLLALWVACGGDDGNGPDGPDGGPVRVIANTTVNAPDMTDPDWNGWGAVDSFKVPVAQGNSPKVQPAGAAAVPTQIQVQAVENSGQLYLRLVWTDTTFNVDPHYFEVESIDDISVPPRVIFRLGDSYLTPREDQAFVMFAGMTGDRYDVWNWRVLTTGVGRVARGYTYSSSIGLIMDAKGGAPDSSAARRNEPMGNTPTYVHKDSSESDDYILYLVDTASSARIIRWDPDPLNPSDSVPVTYQNTTGWQIGQRVPGWIIDSTLAHLDKAGRGSRWDIDAASIWADSTEYHVVLKRELNTGFLDDLNLSTLDSVEVKIGVYDNQEEFGTASNRRGFTDDFWIIF